MDDPGPRTGEAGTAVVSGGAQGIGRAIAERLALDGFSVLALDLRPQVADTAAALRDRGLPVEGRVCDVTDRESVVAALAGLERVDVCVCAAGVYWPARFETATEDDFRRIMEVNLIGVFILAQECARRMGPGGRIIPIASRAALGGAGFPHYVASKAAVVGLTRAMALELRGRNIRVNAVSPGFTDTPMTRSMPETEWNMAASLEPEGRPADPSRIAAAVAFFARADADFVTGQVLYADGGKSLGSLPL